MSHIYKVHKLIWALMRCLYSALLVLIWPFFLVYVLYQRACHGKYRGSCMIRLGLKPVTLEPSSKECIWIHAVSLGETNAAAALLERIVQRHGDKRIIFSHVTQTGYDQAVKVFGSRVEHILLTLDFPWKMKALMKRARPCLLILVESDWWVNFTYYAKAYGARLAVVNARMSPRSQIWYHRFQAFMRGFWLQMDLIAAQSDEQAEIFKNLGVNPQGIRVCGNMKLARQMHPDPTKLERLRLFLPDGDIIALSCSHGPEEKIFLEQVKTLNASRHLRFVIIPRHSQRFNEVQALLQEKGLEMARWSQDPKPCRYLLLDAMGCLNEVYHLARVSLVGGTWCSHIGGHNFLEPVMAGVPTLYGPHVFKQTDFHALALAEELAWCIPADQMALKIEQLLDDKQMRCLWRERLEKFQTTSHQSVDLTLEHLGL